MVLNKKTQDLNEEDAFQFIIKSLNKDMSKYSEYGYDLYLPKIIREYLMAVQEVGWQDTDRYLPDISIPFYSAAWELCRRGIIRPGISKWGEQVTDEGSGGNGYSITNQGKDWIRKATQFDYVPIEPGRFAKIFEGYSKKYGPGFLERAQEAIKCYKFLAYLACCIMCGAAAESIILAIAIAKTKNEKKILGDYLSSGGRGRIESLIIGQKPENLQREFRGYSSLLKYWRDVAGHGKKSDIAESEAYTSLALLLRFALFVNGKWEELVSSGN